MDSVMLAEIPKVMQQFVDEKKIRYSYFGGT